MEHDKFMDRSLADLVSEMTDGMKHDAIRIIPKLLQWLKDYDSQRPVAGGRT